MTRLHTNNLEIGITEAVQRHVTRHVVPPKPISQRKLDFEHRRPRWLREMAAEAIGVFFYVYASPYPSPPKLPISPSPSNKKPQTPL